MKVKRKILAIVMVATLVLGNVLCIHAQEPKQQAIYDLETGGTKVFYLQVRDNKIIRVYLPFYSCGMGNNGG